MNRPRSGDAPSTLGSREQQFFGQVFREIARDVRHRDLLYKHDAPAAEPVPGRTDPLLRDVAIKQDVKVRNSLLCELQNADVGRSRAVEPLEVNPKLVEAVPQIGHGQPFVFHLYELLWVQGEREEIAEAQTFSHAANARPGCPGFARAAVGAAPGPAVYPPIDFVARLRVRTANGQTSAVFSAPYRADFEIPKYLVTIIR